MTTVATREWPLLSLFRPAFTVATFARAQLLGVAAILTNGRRTLANLPRTVADLTEGDPSGYHRVLSLARWSALSLAAILTRFVIQHFWAKGRIRAGGDGTVCEPPWPQRPRQGQPPLHRLALGAQVGGPGHPGPLPLRSPPLGPACAGQPLPLPAGQR